MLKDLIQDGVTFFVVIDPIGLVPLFIAVTRLESPETRRQVAGRSVLVAGSILLAFIVGGQFLLEALEISLPSFQIAGGIVLFLLGLQMVFDKGSNPEHSSPEHSPPQTQADVAIFPLALPLIAGPGTITAAVLLTDNRTYAIPQQAATTGVLLGVLLITYLTLLTAEWVQKILGSTGTNVITRVLGLIVAALAVEIALTGIRHFLLA